MPMRVRCECLHRCKCLRARAKTGPACARRRRMAPTRWTRLKATTSVDYATDPRPSRGWTRPIGWATQWKGVLVCASDACVYGHACVRIRACVRTCAFARGSGRGCACIPVSACIVVTSRCQVLPRRGAAGRAPGLLPAGDPVPGPRIRRHVLLPRGAHARTATYGRKRVTRTRKGTRTREKPLPAPASALPARARRAGGRGAGVLFGRCRACEAGLGGWVCW